MLPRGWKGSAVLFILFCAVVLAVNLGALIWALKHRHHPQASGNDDNATIILREGNDAGQCSEIQNLNRWSHLLINLLSTILLSGSNYCMQCLSAPTRTDVDYAHARGTWLDIGVPSIHNLRRVPYRRLVVWFILGVSSLPLHLFYNSAIFASTSSNNYVVLSVDSKFLTLQNATSSNYADVSYLVRSGMETSKLNVPTTSIVKLADRLRDDANAGRLVNLSTADCIKDYTKTFQSSYRNLLLVSDPDVDQNLSTIEYIYGSSGTIDNNANNLVTYVLARFYSDYTCGQSQAFSWTCGMNGTVQTGYLDQCDRACDEPQILQQTISNATWAPLGPTVHYCLAEPMQESCKLQFSTGIAITVIVLNAVKLAMMVLTCLMPFDKEGSPPLLTMGDAVASFLERPDHPSKGLCLTTGSKVKAVFSGPPELAKFEGVLPYDDTQRRWGRAVSGRRWFICLLLYIAGLATAAGYLGKALNSMLGSKSLQSLWDLGFGTVNGRTLVQNSAMASGNAGGSAYLVGQVLTANIPQLILSLLYFTYNGLFTCMLLANEWQSYALERKGLRISSSSPRGHQRSGYFLQLPYRFSIPLVVFSLIFHWFVSQSIFVVNISVLDYTGQTFQGGPNNIGHLLSCGYSPIAIIFAIILGGLLISGLVGFAQVRFKTGMPIAGSCSLAIASACHTDYSSCDGPAKSTAEQKLKWGEIEGYWPRNDQERIARLRDAGIAHLTEKNPLISAGASETQTMLETSTSSVTQNECSTTPAYSQIPESAQLLPADCAVANLDPTSSSDGNRPEGIAGLEVETVRVGHCGFSTGPVVPPLNGRLYA